MAQHDPDIQQMLDAYFTEEERAHFASLEQQIVGSMFGAEVDQKRKYYDQAAILILQGLFMASDQAFKKYGGYKTQGLKAYNMSRKNDAYAGKSNLLTEQFSHFLQTHDENDIIPNLLAKKDELLDSAWQAVRGRSDKLLQDLGFKKS